MLTVVGALVEQDGRILICRRAEGQWHAGKWEFPGGKVEPGEELRSALRRELQEELGIDASIEEEVERYEFAYPDRQPILLVFFRVRHFQGQIENRIFASVEWAEIHGGLQRSGTPAAPVREALAAGRPVLVEVDLAGARAVRAAMPEAVLTFLAPPSWEVLVERLTGRGTESDEVVARRLETARTELAAQDEFDTVVVNDDVDRACDELVSLLVGPDAGPGPRS